MRLALHGFGGRPFAVAGLAALIGSAAIAAAAEVPDVTGALNGTSLDAAITSKVQQLAALKRNIIDSDCDYAVDATILEGCQQLTAQAETLAAEIDALKAQAGGTAEASVTKLPPPHPMPYTFKAGTSPNMSYRTFCVRMCDGFYYPLNEASTPSSFLADEAKCQSSCSSPTKLFYSVSPGEDAGEMVALTGERYGELANAFRYRTEYVDACACKPKPWTAEAKAAFDRRAILATRSPNEQIVAAGAGEMAKLLASPEVKVASSARATTSTKARYGQASIERARLWAFFRPFRYGAGALAANEPQQQRRFFLFRSR